MVLAATTLLAETKPPEPQPADAPLMFLMGTRKPVRVRVAVNQTTLIRLPDGQRVMNVFGADHGEGGLWTVDAGKVPLQFVAIKPKDTGIRTMLHVISDSGAEQTFSLEEITGKDPQFDPEVEAYSSGNSSKSTGPEAKWVTADEVTSCKAEATAAKLTAKDAESKAQGKADTEMAAFRHDYPRSMVFGYQWDRAKAEKLGLQVAWHDDKFTYFRGNRVLALYEVNEDGTPSLIQFEFKDGLYTVPKVVYDGYFAIGKKKENKVTFHCDRGAR
jgi:type IV secretion system protein VirB9